jgi:hypothetical protein
MILNGHDSSVREQVERVSMTMACPWSRGPANYMSMVLWA